MLIAENIQSEVSQIRERLDSISSIAHTISDEIIEQAPTVIFGQASMEYMSMVKGKPSKYGMSIKELGILTDLLEKMYPKISTFLN
jgi:hypothetical protein